jgi:hypothetical protein
MAGTKPFFTGRDPDVLEQEVGGGCLVLASLPFGVAGIFTVLSSLQRLPWDVPNGATSWIGVGVGGFLCLLALVIMTARSGLRIDRRQGKAVKWNRVIFPFKVTEYPLDRFALIKVDCQDGNHDTGTLYPLSLAGPGGTESLAIHRSADYPEIRRLSEELSRFLGKPVEDNSLGTKIIREPELLNESFRDRMKRTKVSFDILPTRPAMMISKLTETGNGLVLEIPAAPFSRLYVIPAVFGCLFALLFGAAVLPRLLILAGPPAITYGMIAAAFLLFLILPVLSAVSFYRRKSQSCIMVTVSRAFLRVEEKTGGKAKTTEIPAEEIEDLVLPELKALGIHEEGRVADKKVMVSFGRGDNKAVPLRGAVPQAILSFIARLVSPGITIRSDNATRNIGKGLPPEELTWIYHLIAKTITEN